MLIVHNALQVPSTGEEGSLLVIQSYDDLSRKLWRLEGLPLSITSVQGAHPALRYTQVYPMRKALPLLDCNNNKVFTTTVKLTNKFKKTLECNQLYFCCVKLLVVVLYVNML